MAFYKYSVAHRAVTGLSYLGNETRKNAGPSREWRPEGAPTTDEVLHVLLETKRLLITVFSVVIWRLETEISK